MFAWFYFVSHWSCVHVFTWLELQTKPLRAQRFGSNMKRRWCKGAEGQMGRCRHLQTHIFQSIFDDCWYNGVMRFQTFRIYSIIILWKGSKGFDGSMTIYGHLQWSRSMLPMLAPATVSAFRFQGLDPGRDCHIQWQRDHRDLACYDTHTHKSLALCESNVRATSIVQ